MQKALVVIVCVLGAAGFVAPVEAQVKVADLAKQHAIDTVRGNCQRANYVCKDFLVEGFKITPNRGDIANGYTDKLLLWTTFAALKADASEGGTWKERGNCTVAYYFPKAKDWVVVEVRYPNTGPPTRKAECANFDYW